MHNRIRYGRLSFLAASITAALAALQASAAQDAPFAVARLFFQLDNTAVYAFGEIGGPRAVGLLRRASTDSDPYVREAAGSVLAECNRDER